MGDGGETALKEMPENEKTRASIKSAMKLIEGTGPVAKEPESKPIVTTSFDGEIKEIERYWVYEPYTYVSITYDDEHMEYRYNVCEPEMTGPELEILERVYDDLRDMLIRGDAGDGGKKEAILKKAYDSLLNMYGLKLSRATYNNIYYYLARNFIGYGRIDALMRDEDIEDISCNGIGMPIFLFHRRFQNIKTNIEFDDEQELNAMVTLLVQRGGRHISLAEPISNATLPDGSRIEATLGREVTARGSSFTIRKFRDDPFTPVDLIRNNTMSAEILAYLWLAIENNKSLLLAGGTASGKTSSLNAVSLFIPQGSKVITIEDTRELTLFHSNWLASVTREGPFKQEEGEIDMYELLRAALRQRPEYILVGEVRGREALTLFQAMNTGHTTYSTMHAGSVQAVVNRLLNDPINVPNMMLQALNIVSIQEMLDIGGKKIRRTRSIVEITGIDPRTNNLRVNELFRWDSANDTYERLGDSYVLGSIMEKLGWDRSRLSMEIKRRVEILNYLAHENIRDYKSVGIAIHAYRMMPDKVMQLLRKGTLADILQAARR
jgi:flagellar protein FlaI